MSFKRDESDPGPLGALQRRRVAELLASAIPEDEALLLRDGRLACSLCPQRPVCDTLQTLLLHRAGRKHLDSECGWPCHLAPCHPTLGRVPQAPLLARTRRLARSALLRTAPYNSCCRRDSWAFRGKIPKMSHKKSTQQSPKICPKISPRIPKKAPKNPKKSRKSPNPVSLCPSRGWLQDPAGNWVKDGNAEFDSDEEEPPPLPPA
uniref:Sodium channel modifier 1 n=1 Tax=Geospiza parvula TaxID=87175 RepID=A0A8U8BCQ3_GEOPR